MEDIYFKETHKDSQYHYIVIFCHAHKKFMIHLSVRPSGYGELCQLSVMKEDGTWAQIADKYIAGVPYENDYKYTKDADKENREMCRNCEKAFKEFVEEVYF